MLVLYDGVCGFCDASVQWLLRRDEAGLFRFAPLQGETAAEIRKAHPEIPTDLDSVILVDDGKLYWRSAAVFRILTHLPSWRWLSWLRLLPQPLADFGYATFARYRLRVFGRLDACRIPTPAQRARFLP